jgi:tetratricopeptide (TPR) repeat protein
MTNSISFLDSSNTFEERLEILSRELELSAKWRRPAILAVLYGSEDVHAEATVALEQHLLFKCGEKVTHLHLEDGAEKRIVSILQQSRNAENQVYFLDGFEYLNRENKDLLRFLNDYLNLINEKKIRTIIWLAQDEAVDLAHQAPDFWISCQRIVEFEKPLNPEQKFQYALDLAWQGVKDGLGLFETNQAYSSLLEGWLANLTQDCPSVTACANLLLELGIINWRKGDFENANNILQSALQIAIKFQYNKFEAECYNAIALVKSSLGKHEEAIDAYRQAIHLVPDQVNTWNHMGNLCLKTRRNDEAIIAFQKTIEHSPEDPVAWTGLGDVYSQIGYMNDAVHAYKKAIAFTPSFPQPWNGLGNVYTTIGKSDEAIHAYQKSIKLNQQSITPWLGLAHLFVKHERDRDAIKAYQQALVIDPKNSPIWNEIGQVYLKLGNHQEAAHSFSMAIQLDQGFGQAYRNLAFTYTCMGKHLEAISLYTRSIEWFSKEEEKAESWNGLGDVYRRLFEYDNAIVAYQMADKLIHDRFADHQHVPSTDPQSDSVAAVSTKPEMDILPAQSEEIHIALTEESGMQEEPLDKQQPPSWVFPTGMPPELNGSIQPDRLPEERALTSKAPTIQLYPGSQNPSGERGETAMQIALPKFKEIRASSEEVTDSQIHMQRPRFVEEVVRETDSTDAHFWNEKGNAHIQSGDYEAAIQAYNRAIALDISFGRPYNNLAFAHLNLGRLEEALPLYIKGTELLDSDQEKSVSWNGIGFIYRCLKDYHNAMAAYQKADELNPSNTHIYENMEYLHTDPKTQNAQTWIELGDMFFKAGVYREAANAYQHAVATDPTSGAGLSNRALTLVFQGKYREAAYYYQKSIPLFQHEKDKAVVWNRLGDVYRKLDDYDNAISAYQTAIKLTNEPVNLLTRTRFSLLSNCRVH